MNFKNFSVFGCGIYIDNGKYGTQYTFWVEDENLGNSEVVFVNWEKFYLKTYLEEIPKRSVILHCKNCLNLKCEFNPEFHGNKSANVDIEKIFYPEDFEEKRKEKRVDILLKAEAFVLDNFVKNLSAEPKLTEIKITNISSSGCNIVFVDDKKSKIPNVGSNLEIYFKSNVIVKRIKEYEQITIFRLKEMLPFIGEVVWRMQENVGIEFISVRNSDCRLITEMVEYLHELPE